MMWAKVLFIFSQKNDQAKNIFLLQIPKPRPYLKVSPKRWPGKVLFFLPSYAAVRIRTQAHIVALSSRDLYSRYSTDWATATTAKKKKKNIYLTYLTIGEIGRFYFTTVAAIDEVLFNSSCHISSRLWRGRKTLKRHSKKLKCLIGEWLEAGLAIFYFGDLLPNNSKLVCLALPNAKVSYIPTQWLICVVKLQNHQIRSLRWELGSCFVCFCELTVS